MKVIPFYCLFDIDVKHPKKLQMSFFDVFFQLVELTNEAGFNLGGFGEILLVLGVGSLTSPTTLSRPVGRILK